MNLVASNKKMNIFTNPRRIPEDYGIRIAVGLTLYFLVMRLSGLAHIVELRLLNLIILVAGIYLALKKFRKAYQHINYFRALITGVTTAAIGSCIFAVFLFVYMQVDTSMMNYIIEKEPMGRYLNPYIASFIVALEGVFSGLLATFVLINYMETDQPTEG